MRGWSHLTTQHPIWRVDDAGNGYPARALDDGSRHEVLKNVPTFEQAICAIGPRARRPRWVSPQQGWTPYWVLQYELD